MVLELESVRGIKMYSNSVLNLFNNPKNAGRISKPDGIADLFNEDKTVTTM